MTFRTTTRRGPGLPLPEIGHLYGKGDRSRKVTKLIPNVTMPGCLSEWTVEYDVPFTGESGSCRVSRFRSWEAKTALRPLSLKEQLRNAHLLCIDNAKVLLTAVIKGEGTAKADDIKAWLKNAAAVPRR